MKKEYCKDCVCLIEGNNEEWVCDEKGVEISKIKRCPETGELEEEEDKKKSCPLSILMKSTTLRESLMLLISSMKEQSHLVLPFV